MEDERFTKEKLYSKAKKSIYKGKYLNQISFPLGGIGTGSIGLNGRGNLKDFEIFNRPNVGSTATRTFPLIWVEEEGVPSICRVLEGPLPRPYTPIDGGKFKANAEGFPHIDSVEFKGEYPFAWLKFLSKKLPLDIELEAYNPYIPSDPESSGIPCAILKYKVKNNSDKNVSVGIMWSLLNMVGFTPDDFRNIYFKGDELPQGQFINTIMEEGGLKGLIYKNMKYEKNHPLYGSMALTSPDSNVTITPYWKQSPWFTSHYHIWDHFKKNGDLKEFDYRWRGTVEDGTVSIKKAEAGAIAIKKEIKPGESELFTFYITWLFPTFAKYWNYWKVTDDYDKMSKWKNHYAKNYEDAFEIALNLHEKESELHEKTKLFHDALFSSTLPPYILDAISSNMALLKTTTCLRLEDGTFYGFEGCHPSEGCCEGSCTHVWGYQQALPFLFPSLERSMHDANYKYSFDAEDLGALHFRIPTPLGTTIPKGWSKPCADGQLGGIMQVYREWKLSGDDKWLEKNWLGVKRALEFAWVKWDMNKTGVLRDFQHNTYDIDFLGPNPMLTSFYLGALKAGSELAKAMNDEKNSQLYLEIYERGRLWVDENLFNGEFYIQKYDKEKAKWFQIADGCLTDQLLGQEVAKIAGLENFYKDENILTTLKSIFKYNWMPNMKELENGARLYAVNEEAGTVECTWPLGGRPEVPFPYADELFFGSEYQFATHLIMEDLVEFGLIVAKSVRDRFDGWGRNPWDEFECGHHYARSMASYGLLIALSGFEFDKGAGLIGFSPVINQKDFKCFWSMDNVWGIYSQNENKSEIEVLFGEIELRKIKLTMFKSLQNLKLNHNGKILELKVDENGDITLENPIILKKNENLVISLVL